MWNIIKCRRCGKKVDRNALNELHNCNVPLIIKPIELEYHIREYVNVLKDEPAEDLMKVKDIYHDLKRMLGDEC